MLGQTIDTAGRPSAGLGWLRLGPTAIAQADYAEGDREPGVREVEAALVRHGYALAGEPDERYDAGSVRAMRAFVDDQLARLDALAIAYAAHSPDSTEARVVGQAHAELASEAVALREGRPMGTWTAALLASPITDAAGSTIETALGSIEAFAPKKGAMGATATAGPPAGTPYQWNGTPLSVGSADVAGEPDAPVAAVQQRLVDLDAELGAGLEIDLGPGGVDGVYGGHAREAVQAFQSHQLALLTAAIDRVRDAKGVPEGRDAQLVALRTALLGEKARGVVGASTGEALEAPLTEAGMDAWVQRLLEPPTGAEALAHLRALTGEPSTGAIDVAGGSADGLSDVQRLRDAMRWMGDVNSRSEAREQLAKLLDPEWTKIGVALERLAPGEIERFVDTITPWLTARELGLVFTGAGRATQTALVDAVAEHGTPAVQREFATGAQRRLIEADTEIGLGLTDAERAQMLDLAQMALDLAGMVDPTGLADGSNAVISLLRGDWFGAGVSAVSMLPVLGDMAKLGKLGDWARTTHEVVAHAAADSAFYQKVEPALTKLSELIDAIPAGALRGELKGQIEDIAAALDGVKDPEASGPEVHRSARGTEAPNAAINARPAERIPNHTYNVDDRAYYTTDGRGRVVSMDAIITAETIADRPRRSDYSQRSTVEADGYVGFDEGGHLLSHANGGAGERINIVPLDGAINRGPGSRWTEMERMIQDEARAGRTVEMNMTLEYGSDEMPNRPTNIYIDVYIEGVKIDVPYEFDNLKP